MKQNIIAGKLTDYLDNLLQWSASIVSRLLISALVLWVGLKVIKVSVNFLKRNFERHGVEAIVASFLVSFINIGLKVLLFFLIAGILDVELSSFLTLLGSAGIAIGLALQGSLANIAGGVLILILKPFKIGDYIIEDNKGNEGTVTGIDIFYTKLQSVDNKTIVIPNGVISNTSLTNVTKQDKRRLDIYVGVGYHENLKVVKDILTNIVLNEPNTMQEDEIDVFVNKFEESSINMGIRFWVPMDLYFPTKWSVLEKIKVEFDNNHINFPYNHLSVDINNNDISSNDISSVDIINKDIINNDIT